VQTKVSSGAWEELSAVKQLNSSSNATSPTVQTCFFALQAACRGTFETGCLDCAQQHANSLRTAGCTNDDIHAECSTGHLMQMNVSISAKGYPYDNHPRFIAGVQSINAGQNYMWGSTDSAPTIYTQCIDYSPSPADVVWYAGTSLDTYADGSLQWDQIVLQLKGTPDMGPLGNTSKFKLSGWSNNNISACLPPKGCLDQKWQDYTVDPGESITFHDVWRIDYHGLCKK
jgi:hypothetical protein